MQNLINKNWMSRGLLFLIAAGIVSVMWLGKDSLAPPLSAAFITPLPTKPFSPPTPWAWVMPTLAPLPPEVANDPALRNPLFASMARQYGTDWEKHLGPDGRQWLDWQRKIGSHALITSATGGDPAAVAKLSKFMIGVWEWDHTDLFALGLPQMIEGKPVEIIELGFADYGIVPFRGGK